MTDFKSDHWFGDIRSHLIKNMPKDSEFLEKFKTAQFQESDQTKYILDKLEIETYNTANEGIKVRNRFSVHIEHIAPKTMSNVNDWQGFAKLDDETRKEYITSIGNLTLLEKRPNIKASNNPFDEKKQFYTEKNTSMRMTQDLLKYDEWGVDAIERRSGKLAEKALKIWHFDEK